MWFNPDDCSRVANNVVLFAHNSVLIVREGLAIEVDFSLPSERVVRCLNQIIEWRGKPKVIRVDNGPENISATLMLWAENRGIEIQHIQPGKPQQNAYIERYNRTVRHEWLAQNIFETIEEAQDQATQWLWTYNNDPPQHGDRRDHSRNETETGGVILLSRPLINGGITLTCETEIPGKRVCAQIIRFSSSDQFLRLRRFANPGLVVST